ncbi:MAG: hypothetical protein M1818_001637 [Claussenomyces sp. TS43310]|nr:MAG: hypothetical protein M1818_001637 [Claussenomyces sp. TS43310]
MRLLANNVGGLEDRLVNIEKELARLTDALHNGNRVLPLKTSTEDEPVKPPEAAVDWTETWHPSSLSKEMLVDSNISQPPDRHIVHCQDDLSDRYHGPCTLVALCNEFRDRLLGMQRAATNDHTHEELLPEDKVMRSGEMTELLIKMCASAGIEEPVDLDHDKLQIFLPPKQLLLMACTSFFQQEDAMIDVFCQSAFCQNLEKIYNRPFTTADNTWALCFNIVILLVLGAEQSESSGSGDPGIGSQFVLPFISSIHCALACPRILMGPKLINIQTLALLGVAAQQYLPPSYAETILAQACLLAKRMGLHQHRGSSGTLSAEDSEERMKVLRSLYLRDKSLSLSRGLNCWLPSFDCSLAFGFEKINAFNVNTSARLHLARLQENIYRVLYSTESLRQLPAQRKAALLRVEKSLVQWAEAYDSSDCLDASLSVDWAIILEFRASRVVALRTSPEAAHKEQVVHDARKSCRLLSNSMGRLDGIFIGDRDDASMGSPSAGSTTSAIVQEATFSRNYQIFPTTPHKSSELRIRSLIADYSIPAFFALVENIIWPVLEDNVQGDIRLLQNVCQLFEEFDNKTQAHNSSRKSLQAFQSLLAVVKLLKPELFPQEYPFRPREQQAQEPPQTHHHYHDSNSIDASQSMNILPTGLSPNFSGFVPSMPNLPRAFPPPTLSAYSTSSNTRSSSPPYDMLNPIDYDGSSHHYDLSQQTSYSSSPGNQHKRQCLTMGNTAETRPDEWHHQQLFSLFPNLNSMLPL